jgi:hypothetical protein
VLRNLDVFRSEVGPECVARALATLSEDAQAQMEALVPAAWVPVEIVDTSYAAIAREAGRELDELYPLVVKQGVRNALQTVWRWLLRLTTDRALVSRTPMIYDRGHNTGQLATEITSPGNARIVLTGWPEIPKLRMMGLACGIQATLEVAGRRDVEVTFDSAPDGAVFQARWKA